MPHQRVTVQYNRTCMEYWEDETVMTTIGLIGAGHIGSQIARLAIASGYDVVSSNSREPKSLSGLVAELVRQRLQSGVIEL